MPGATLNAESWNGTTLGAGWRYRLPVAPAAARRAESLPKSPPARIPRRGARFMDGSS